MATKGMPEHCDDSGNNVSTLALRNLGWLRGGMEKTKYFFVVGHTLFLDNLGARSPVYVPELT